MFEHSVKVPRHYKIAANIFKKVSTEGGSVKTLLYDDKLRHYRTNVLYALITETIKHAADLDKVFESCNLLTNEARLDPWLAKVLATELLYGKKAVPGKSKPEQTIVSYKEQFETFLSEHTSESKTEAVRRPRYVRINTNMLTTSDAIGAFQDEGYRFIRCTSGSYDDYLKQISGLTEYDFTQDYHVKTVFVFSPGTKLHEHDLYLENKIILQDKATALAVHLLCPPSDSVALDMCAAPGMKTTQLAAYMRNQGKIYAVERNERRYQTLCEFVERTGSKCVQTLHKDSLDIKRGEMDDVEYILLDPSCSGSGMDLCVHNYIEESRLAKLTSLQEKFLKHAMNAFPKAKKIVYSTCSLFPEENERVITNVVKTSRAKWRVLDVKELLKGQWNNIGSGMYGSMGTRCLYAKPDADLTTGFFLAVLERDAKDLEKSLCLENVTVEEEVRNGKGRKIDPEIKEGKKCYTHEFQNENYKVIEEEMTPEEASDKFKKGNKNNGKKHKNKTEKYQTVEEAIENDMVIEEEVTAEEAPNEYKEVGKNNHKKLKNKTENNQSVEEAEIPELDMTDKKKRKKKKLIETELYDGSVIIITSNHEHADVNVESERKKKNKKNKKCTQNLDVNETINEITGSNNASKFDENTNRPERKHNHKKKNKVKNHLDLASIIEQSNQNGVPEDEFNTPSDGKKSIKVKKSKSLDNKTTEDTTTVDVGEKSKIKRKHETSLIDEPSVKKSTKEFKNLAEDNQQTNEKSHKRKKAKSKTVLSEG